MMMMTMVKKFAQHSACAGSPDKDVEARHADVPVRETHWVWLTSAAAAAVVVASYEMVLRWSHKQRYS